MTEIEEAFSEKEYSEEKNNHECSTKLDHIYHKIPSLLSDTLIELIDCADDMIEALSSMTIQQSEKNKDGKENMIQNGYDNVNHIFQIPQLINTNDDIKKYTDFTVIGRKVLTILKLSYH